MKKEKDTTTETLIKSADIEYINQLLKKGDVGDFQMSKSTLSNIAGWALNGDSDAEIRKRLDLNKHQWAILCTVCPTMIMIMQHSRAMADLVVAGSLFQTAIGGKRIKKQVPVKEKIYEWNEDTGKSWVVGEKTTIVEIEEELPPNPLLLKFLAENKLSEQFGDKKGVNDKKIKEFVESLTPEDRALLEAARKNSELNNEN